MIEIQYEDGNYPTVHIYYLHDRAVEKYMIMNKIKTHQKAILYLRNKDFHIRVHCDLVLRGHEPETTIPMQIVESELRTLVYILKSRKILQIDYM